MPILSELTQAAHRTARRIVPGAVRRVLVRSVAWPPVGMVSFGSLRRVQPISRNHGGDRGQPIDRYYIERFLSDYSQDVCGHVLEVADDTYTRAFGQGRVTRSDVLHVCDLGPKVTIIADLARPNQLDDNVFDCVILTQTLQYIYDASAAISTVHRILKPGGVALVTVPGITKIGLFDTQRWGHYWTFTTQSAQRLFGEVFSSDRVQVQAYGNVLTAIAFLHGLAAGELTQHELDSRDTEYELVVTIRAQKSI